MGTSLLKIYTRCRRYFKRGKNQLQEMIEKQGQLRNKNAQLRLTQATSDKAKLNLQ